MFVNFGSPIVLSVLCFYFHYFRDEFPRRFQIKYQDKMSFIIISLSLVSYQDSSKVILTSTMAQNKLGRHHDNGKSFSVKSWRRANIVSVCRKSTVNTSQKICGSALLCIVIKHWVLTPAETELSSECLLLFGQFLVASALGKEEDVRKYQG